MSSARVDDNPRGAAGRGRGRAGGADPGGRAAGHAGLNRDLPPLPRGTLRDIALHVAGADRSLLCDILLDNAVAMEAEAGSRKNSAVKVALLVRAGRLRQMAETVRPPYVPA